MLETYDPSNCRAVQVGVAVRKAWWAVGVQLLCALLGACSMSFDDGQGGRRIIGFVDLTVTPAPPGTPVAGKVVDLTTIGIAVADTADGGHLSLGYTRDVVAVLRDDSLVLGDPLAVRHLFQTSPSVQTGATP
jgi:hypothetical protein